jgi:hypothetical protein
MDQTDSGELALEISSMSQKDAIEKSPEADLIGDLMFDTSGSLPTSTSRKPSDFDVLTCKSMFDWWNVTQHWSERESRVKAMAVTLLTDEKHYLHLSLGKPVAPRFVTATFPIDPEISDYGFHFRDPRLWISNVLLSECLNCLQSKSLIFIPPKRDLTLRLHHLDQTCAVDTITIGIVFGKSGQHSVSATQRSSLTVTD